MPLTRIYTVPLGDQFPNLPYLKIQFYKCGQSSLFADSSFVNSATCYNLFVTPQIHTWGTFPAIHSHAKSLEKSESLDILVPCRGQRRHLPDFLQLPDCNDQRMATGGSARGSCLGSAGGALNPNSTSVSKAASEVT